MAQLSHGNVPQHKQDSIYHEKQSLALCAVHALNNLFQNENSFSKKDLDEICMTLSPNSRFLNPHRSMLGIGDYDVNVVMAALQLRDCDTVWFDKRKSLEELNISAVRGFILNMPSGMRIGFMQLPIKRKHWLAICRIDSLYYNLDSKNNDPRKIGDESELRTYLKQQLSSKDTELLIVVDQSVDKDTMWTNKRPVLHETQQMSDNG